MEIRQVSPFMEKGARLQVRTKVVLEMLRAMRPYRVDSARELICWSRKPCKVDPCTGSLEVSDPVRSKLHTGARITAVKARKA